MNIIAFDTAQDTCSLGLSVLGRTVTGGTVTRGTSGNVRYYLEIAGGQKHSECIMDGADALLRLAGLPKTSLEGAACMEGPGSFTGLRIGFAAAKGIASALDVPLISVPTLDCMAAPFSFWPGIVLPLLDAKKNAFFAAAYRRGKRLTEYLDAGLPELIKTITALPPETSGTLLLTGPGAPLALGLLSGTFPGTLLDPGHSRGRAAELLNMAEEKHILKQRPAKGPVYLRKSDAELSG